MKASEWRQTLGSMATTAQDAIVAALTDPNMLVPIEWVGIPISGGGHDAILYVGCDSLKVGEPDDCVRVNVSMSAHQQVCDALGLQMPTAKMLDVIYANREVTAEPCTYQIGANGNITVIDPATGAQTPPDSAHRREDKPCRLESARPLRRWRERHLLGSSVTPAPPPRARRG